MRTRISRNHDSELQGHPHTRQRQIILDIIRDVERHIDAKELFKLAASKDSSISTATVYRSLKLFKELDLITEKRLGRASCYYEAKGAGDHQHLVCSICGKVVDFNCPLQEMIKRVKAENGFTVTNAEVFLEGYCAECSKG